LKPNDFSLEMKKYSLLLLICLSIGMFSCNRHDSGKNNAANNDSAALKAKNDSLINAANKMSAPDTIKPKKDSIKTK
jgi:hypothetical protein